MKKDRIIYLDLMRAFAVLMMVQGHTVDSLLANEFRTESSVFYFIWHTMRGFTAPIFMFTAGVVFTYLLLLGEQTSINKKRFTKGLNRFLILVGLGYLLRYPTYTLINFQNISPLQWKIFYSVDTLHLIGFGILFILIVSLISEKLKINKLLSLASISLMFFIPAPFISTINFQDYVHPFIAGYFNNINGSLFPLFPWAGYVLAGSVLGTILAKREKVFTKPVFMYSLIGIGITSIVLHLVYLNFGYLFGTSASIASSYSLIIFRLGFVLLLSGVFALASKNINSIPQIIKTVGKHTLSIYVVHSVILYGSAWSPSLSWLIGKTFSPVQVVIAAIFMVSLMIIMAYQVEKLSTKKLLQNKLKPLVQSFLVK